MASPFVKLSAELHQNPKVRKAGRNAREVFVFILCRNALMDSNGTLTVREVEAWFLADQLMMTEAEAQHGFDRAVACDLLSIEGDRVSIVGWNDEWARRPLTEAERKARSRKNKGLDEESHEMSRSDRDMSRPNTPCPESHTGEERREEEKRSDSGSPSEPGACEPAKKSRKRPSVSLPDGWSPSDKAKAKASELRVDLHREAEKFRNHADATDRKCANWDAAFSNWLLSAAERGSQQRLGSFAKPEPVIKSGGAW